MPEASGDQFGSLLESAKLTPGKAMQVSEALDFLPVVKGLMAAGSEDVWRMDGAFPTIRA